MEDFTNLTKEQTLNFLIKLLQALRAVNSPQERIESLKTLIKSIAGEEWAYVLTDEQCDILAYDDEDGEIEN